MFQQSAEQLIPFLQLLDQPAFCLDAAGTVTANAAARRLAPRDADALSAWLGDGAPLYEAWDRTSLLEIPVSARGETFFARFTPLSDGTAVLLKADRISASDSEALSVAAQVLMQPLTNMHSLIQQLSDEPALEPFADTTAAMTRQIYQITRLSRNLSDLTRLQEGKSLLPQELLDVRNTMTPLLEEVQALCADMGRVFDYQLPEKSIAIMGCWYLLERAFLNLISNALKYGDPDAPIRFCVEPAGSYLLVRVSNRCSEGGSMLLQSAFTRLEDRGLIPDPRWGVGLGLPIVQSIARIHGGMTAVEVTESQIATVCMSLSRRRSVPQSVLVSSFPAMDPTGGLRPTLVELADILPSKTFEGI